MTNSYPLVTGALPFSFFLYPKQTETYRYVSVRRCNRISNIKEGAADERRTHHEGRPRPIQERADRGDQKEQPSPRKLGEEPRAWLKSYEVRKLLGISAGTLQNLRVNGTLPYTKIGGLMYYRFEDIQKLMEGGE